jgi:ankyrin repeat protein
MMRFRVKAAMPLLLSACLVLAAPAALAQGQAQGQAPSSAEVARFFRSVQLDDAGTVKKMLAAVNPNQVNPAGGEPALVQALREGAMKVVDVLLAQPGIDLETPAMNGNTALMMAAYQHNAPAVTMLLARGAKVMQPGWTALHYAAAAGDDAIARQLLERGAAIDAPSPPASGKFTPLMMAAREGHDRTVQLLLRAGADPALRNSEGLTAQQIAARAGHQFIADALVNPPK